MGRDQRIIDELGRFERLCLELADDSTMPEERAGLLEMAGNYRDEAARLLWLAPSASRSRILGSRSLLGRCISYLKSLLDRSPAITWRSSPAWCSLQSARCLR
jgi:hypothetical protein